MTSVERWNHKQNTKNIGIEKSSLEASLFYPLWPSWQLSRGQKHIAPKVEEPQKQRQNLVAKFHRLIDTDRPTAEAGRRNLKFHLT